MNTITVTWAKIVRNRKAIRRDRSNPSPVLEQEATHPYVSDCTFCWVLPSTVSSPMSRKNSETWGTRAIPPSNPACSNLGPLLESASCPDALSGLFLA